MEGKMKGSEKLKNTLSALEDLHSNIRDKVEGPGRPHGGVWASTIAAGSSTHYCFKGMTKTGEVHCWIAKLYFILWRTLGKQEALWDKQGGFWEEMKNSEASEIDVKYASPEWVGLPEAPSWSFAEPASINLNHYWAWSSI